MSFSPVLGTFFLVDSLLSSLCSVSQIREKLRLLDAHPSVAKAVADSPYLFSTLSPEEEMVGKQLLVIGQWERIIGEERDPLEIAELLKKLLVVDSFYREMGGLVGYQEKVKSFLENREDERSLEAAAFHSPAFIDICEESEEVWDAILSGLQALPETAELYPLGGAADRLHLVDEETGSELPAAKLPYGGRTLLEGLIRDLAAREFLYFRLFGRQLETPIAMMTSLEKGNHRHVLSICEEQRWFGRRRESFRFFTQPLVPAVNRRGDWCLLGPMTPLLKPGGHGALWKLASDEGVLRWLMQLGRKQALVRQINNPIASLDYGLFAFVGLGVKRKAVFGFASCPRLVESAEGVNVVIEKKNGEVALTNIEYCDFVKYGIEDRPIKEGEPYSRFSSNTNILFVSLRAIERAVKICPYPGLLVNRKETAYTTLSGEKRKEEMARLESTMQNIADVFVESALHFRKRGGELKKTFVTYNQRHKTIATAKKAFVPGGPLRETPEECFYTQLQSARELLERCQFLLPPRRSLAEMLEQGPDSLFLYHPALGPFYSLIAAKLRGGKLAPGAELLLEIADLEICQLELSGSLRILSTQPMGHYEGDFLRYSHRTGRCLLRNVRVDNAGVNWKESAPYWKQRLCREEGVTIQLNGFSEFVAEDVQLRGEHHFVVEEGTRMRLIMREGKLIREVESLCDESFWVYRLKEKGRGILALRHQSDVGR
ncbi:MAG: UTP--glucose-1-phosphate uridylyltransferase [Verrucomicrobiota bacterium]|nr:UTP--glucose-1-phosphate uridylyltransferase [Verrucomicrobiota bacterium]